MRLTRFTDYALRVLMFVGRQRERTCTMSEIAAYYQISLEHLRKVVHRMAKLGYLNTSRGKGGGIVLARNPATIHIGDVIVAMEEDMNIVDCYAMDCVLLPGCSLKTALDRGARAFVAAMNEFTLADLLANRGMKKQFRNLDIAVQFS
ncbi:MAG TPA: Rrf2 family transcriptional regulator [Burkholderiales bacterium]|nr:Rrf2 family transcriptional regulator [Burkholderiales bacterium]